MNNIIKPALILALVAFVASFVLSHVKQITYPNILKQAKEKENRALAIVLPAYNIIEKKSIKSNGQDFIYWLGEKDTDGIISKAYAFIASKPGYSGEVRSMVGVDSTGKILGLYILKQTETPGLGARCEEIASKSTFIDWVSGNINKAAESSERPWFQSQFYGLNSNKEIAITKKGNWNENIADELIRNNAITSISGATITSKTVIDSLAQSLLILKTEIIFEEIPEVIE